MYIRVGTREIFSEKINDICTIIYNTVVSKDNDWGSALLLVEFLTNYQ